MRRDNCILTPTTLSAGGRFLSPVTAEETRDVISFCNVDIPVAPGVPGVETSTPATDSYSYVIQPEMGLQQPGRCAMTKACAVFAFVAIIFGAVTMSGHAQSTEFTIVKCTGADSTQGRIRTIASVFMKANPHVKVELVKAQTLDVGIHAVLNKDADIAMASRQINQEEKVAAEERGFSVSEKLAGCGCLVFVNHSSNPVNSLTVQQVQAILKGEFTNWNQLGGPDRLIEVFRPDVTYPGTVIFLQEEFLCGVKFTDNSTSIATFPEILRRVSQRPGALGCVRIKAIEGPRPAEEEIKVIGIKKEADSEVVMPSRETMRNGTYPIRRPYYLYFDEKANDAVKHFAQFVCSKGCGPGY